MSSTRLLATTLGLLFCAGCGGGAEPVQSPAPARAITASTHDADCRKLVAALDLIESKGMAVDDDGPPDAALRAGMQITEQGAADLSALAVPDATAHRLAGEYTTHLRAKLALMKELLPPLERFSTAATAAKQAQAESDAELEPCKLQAKLSKACEAKLRTATDKAMKASMAAADAQIEMRTLLESPVMKERDAKLTARDQELAQQLHEQCAGPKPLPPHVPAT